MTIEARTAIYGASSAQQHIVQSNRRDSISSNGYQDSKSEDDDGYFTSAVSVQHKVISFSLVLCRRFSGRAVLKSIKIKRDFKSAWA